MPENNKPKVLYITYLGLLESIPQSQVLPYLLKLREYADIYLVTFEKKALLKNKIEEYKKLKKLLSVNKIIWHKLTYHKYPQILSSFFDIFTGFIFSLFLVVRHGISIIHARSNVPIAIGFILRSITGAKLLYDRRGIMAEDHIEHSGWRKEGCLYRMAMAFEKIAVKRSDAIVVLTERMNKYLKDNFRSDVLIQTIPCCVDMEKFAYDEKKRIGLRNKFGLYDKFVFIYSGSLGTYNLLDEMFDFFKTAKDMIHNAHFFILTQDKDRVISLLNEYRGINKEQFTIESALPPDVPAYLSMADAGLIFRRDSVTAIAACPTKFGEYLACGLPVVSMSKIGDVAAIINSNSVGAVLDSYAPSEYRKSIAMLLSLCKEKNNLRQRCRDTAEEVFSLQRGAMLYQEAYNYMLGEK